MGRSAIVISLAGLGCLAGCSFVDDFDKFKSVEDNALPGEDAAVERDAATDATGQVRSDSATPTPSRDAAMEDASATAIDSSVADAAVVVVDAYVPPPTCGAIVCDDGDVCTQNLCEGGKCVFPALDVDGDGFSPGTCKAGSSIRGGDCDDNKKDVKPGASEICDGIDNNCNGQVDEGFTKIACYPDTDRDDYPNLDGKPVAACTTCPDFTVAVTNPNDRTKHDCYDDPANRAELVFPGQTNWYDEGYGPGGKNERKWDYDCSGAVETEHKPLGGGCLGLLGLVCDSSMGFVGDKIPGCGETGPYQMCRQNGLTCEGSTSSVKQQCH